jgi:hypothetical protein
VDTGDTVTSALDTNGILGEKGNHWGVPFTEAIVRTCIKDRSGPWVASRPCPAGHQCRLSGSTTRIEQAKLYLSRFNKQCHRKYRGQTNNNGKDAIPKKSRIPIEADVLRRAL